ncbi:MAG TPA: DUF3014 domain-containing protein [Rhodocyclaceae bacterium]|nr:DUF3014 domain-containing protein [Rhodocyclaceae bacterium]
MEPIQVERDELMLARDDRASGRRRRALLTGAALLAALAAAGYWAWKWIGPAESQAPLAEAPAPAAPPTASGPIEAPPVIENPVAQTPSAEPLPALDESDSALSQTIAGLVGEKAFAALFRHQTIVRRIVATVDGLPRQSAPVNRWPVEPAGTWLETGTIGGETVLVRGNARRYAPYMQVVRAIDMTALAAAYRRFYPLFQEAYVDLGYPKRYFNDRLIVALDDLIAAPEVSEPRLVQVKVRYAFADPELEQRSAGQKIMMRIGVENERLVKDKLRELRRAVAKAEPAQ